MKKNVLLFVLIVVNAAFLAAEDYDSKVRAAVNALASRLNSPLEISIGDIFLDGTESPTGLSRSLYNRISLHAVDNRMFNVTARSRSASRVTAGSAQTGLIQGTYELRGNNVEITLRLISVPGGRILGQSQFSVPVSELSGIEILPANLQTQEAVREQEKIFTAVPTTTISVTETQAFRVAAWPNSDTNTFIDGDELIITIESNRDCFFAVYHTDKYNRTQMIFPVNRNNYNNRLQANVPRTIPDPGIRYNVQEPFGQDTIIVVASTGQFTFQDSEFAQIQQAAQGVIDNIIRGRGLGIQQTDQPVQEETVSTRFHFTSLPSTYFDDSFSYQRPENLGDILDEMRAEAIRLGGTLSGNEQEGTFSYPGVQGRYWISGNRFFVSLRYTSNQAVIPQTRSMRNPHIFYIERPRNMTEAIMSVRSGVEANGGTFSGDEQQGNFRASGIAGQYNVADRVNVRISEKPVIIPNSLIEREVRSFFSGR